MQGYTDGPVEVDYYSRDSVKDNADIELLNADPIATDEAGYPKDAFLQQPQYNIPVAGDEYIFPLEHDKYTSLERDLALRKGEAGTTMALKIFGHMVSLTDDPVNGCLQLGAKIASPTIGISSRNDLAADWFSPKSIIRRFIVPAHSFDCVRGLLRLIGFEFI